MINQDVKAIISNTLGVDEAEISEHAHFMLDLNAGADEIKELKEAVETHFDISITLEEQEFPETVGELDQIIEDLCL